MRIPRVYVPSVDLIPDQLLSLPESVSQHLLRVLRLQEGAIVRVFDGHQHEHAATLCGIQKHQAQIRIGEAVSTCAESPVSIHLGQAVSRGDKMDYTIQKSVELGVTAITPLFTTYSGVNLSGERLNNRLTHWRHVIISACEQCGRSFLPTLHPPITLQEWLTQQQATDKFLLAPNGAKRLRDIELTTQQISLLAGCEGGLSDAEILLAESANFAGICLGSRILRTETAALAAISAIQCLWGDLG